MSDDVLTFSELRKIQKQESRREELSELTEKFLLRVNDYFERKEEASGKDREYRNAKRIFDKILSLREDKIVRNAKIAVKSGKNSSDLNLLPFEQKLFRNLKNSFKEHREHAEKQATGDGASQTAEVEFGDENSTNSLAEDPTAESSDEDLEEDEEDED
ncbi:MAG: hypothetical protein BRC26_03270, partial [Nanohaloarchaea archaeon QH_8_44_6]